MSCTSDPEDRANREMDKRIREKLRQDKEMAKRTHKLLLLGTGDSGKTTFVKQMKILYGGGFTESEIQTYTADIMNNLVDGMKILVEGMEKLDIPYSGGDNMESLARDITNYNHHDLATELGPGVGSVIVRLWEDSGVKECFKQRSKLQIPDSTGYFLDAMTRMTEEGYVPTEMDILMSRKSTSGVVENQFTLKDQVLVFVDVAGQRGERRKWIHQFEQVTAVIFLTAVSEFDQMLWEDQNINRVLESKNLFADLLKNIYFSTTPFIIFFNKKDLFDTKIGQVDLKTFFPEYDGPTGNADEAMKFMKSLFKEGHQNRRIYAFDTVAINTENAKMVSLAVQNIIFERAIDDVPIA